MKTNLSFKVLDCFSILTSLGLGGSVLQGRQVEPGSPLCSSASPHTAARVLCCATTASPLAIYTPQNRFYTCQGTQAPILRTIRQLLASPSPLLTTTCLHLCSQNTTQIHSTHTIITSLP